MIPGASSILIALVGSGFSTENFSFRGFLPVKSGQRERELQAAAEGDETTIFFESPYRLTKTLKACIDIMPDRHLCVARELTKKFEEFRRGTARELFAHDGLVLALLPLAVFLLDHLLGPQRHGLGVFAILNHQHRQVHLARQDGGVAHSHDRRRIEEDKIITPLGFADEILHLG